MRLTDQQINDAFANHILDVEARRDSKGRLEIYPLPEGDGGGTFEVAGINDRYHPEAAKDLAALISTGQYDEAEEYASDYLFCYTHRVNEWHPDEIIEGYLRSCAFNRGDGGAAWMFQYALKYGFYPSLYKGKMDWKVGKNTRAGARKAKTDTEKDTLLAAIHAARVIYERTSVPGLKRAFRKEDSKFWHGLFRRFNTDMAFAMGLNDL